MGQKGFFDVERRLEAISAKGDPLETIKKIVPWEDFRTDIEAVTETKPEERKSNAGRKPYDTILKFKIMVLQSLHNLSDDRTEYLIRDRISFMRFLDLFSWIVIHVGDVVHRSKDEFLARRGDSTVRAITDAVR